MTYFRFTVQPKVIDEFTTEYNVHFIVDGVDKGQVFMLNSQYDDFKSLLRGGNNCKNASYILNEENN